MPKLFHLLFCIKCRQNQSQTSEQARRLSQVMDSFNSVYRCKCRANTLKQNCIRKTGLTKNGVRPRQTHQLRGMQGLLQYNFCLFTHQEIFYSSKCSYKERNLSTSDRLQRGHLNRCTAHKS